MTWSCERADADRGCADAGGRAGVRSRCRVAEAAAEQLGGRPRQRHHDRRARSHLDHSPWRSGQAGRRDTCAAGHRVRRGGQRGPDVGRPGRRLRLASAGAWHHRRRKGSCLDQRQRRRGRAHTRVHAQGKFLRQIGRAGAGGGSNVTANVAPRDANARRSREKRGLRIGRRAEPEPPGDCVRLGDRSIQASLGRIRREAG